MKITMSYVFAFVFSFVSFIIIFNLIGNFMNSQEDSLIKSMETYNLSGGNILRFSFEFNVPVIYLLEVNYSGNISTFESDNFEGSYLLDINISDSGTYFLKMTFCDIYSSCEFVNKTFTK